MAMVRAPSLLLLSGAGAAPVLPSPRHHGHCVRGGGAVTAHTVCLRGSGAACAPC